MKKLVATIALVMALMYLGSAPQSAQARAPSYLILRAPARTPKGHTYYSGRGYEVRTQAYAYGWFGVQPRSHARRSTGYYSSYIQWSKQ